jgi:hypothetical protein
MIPTYLCRSPYAWFVREQTPSSGRTGTSLGFLNLADGGATLCGYGPLTELVGRLVRFPSSELPLLGAGMCQAGYDL